jgi:hypothetical protein
MSTIINGTSSAITFPDSSVQNTSAIVSGYVPYANLPAGSVLQVVSVTNGTQVVTTTSGSWVDTGVTATITPRYSTSKIAVLVTQSYEHNITSSQNNAGAALQILRNSTTVLSGVGNYGAVYQYMQNYSNTNGRGMAAQICSNVVDSPATTSATTYKVQMQTGNSGQMYFQSGNTSASSIILMEIAA